MQVKLRTKRVIVGYSELFGVSHTRIKARGRKPNNNWHCNTIDYLRKTNGSYTSEWRLVKEPCGYIFREVLGDSGISGHHKTMKAAIVSALPFATIHVDEPFEHELLPDFYRYKKFHEARNNGCKHNNVKRHNRYTFWVCPDCNETWDSDTKMEDIK
ncbi:hypothetical protein [uncultured Draconibacterium sp.]|uniref:hypothetical protein n=1 Tax=uncultured Draconibacterium sp. TaxID=1573823 RepID=UPI0025FD8FCC|nr:hypothetical protein [uncultured Draconibacterium sp.]